MFYFYHNQMCMTFLNVFGHSPSPTEQNPNSLSQTFKAFLVVFFIEHNKSPESSNTFCTLCAFFQPRAILQHPVNPLHSLTWSLSSLCRKAFLKSFKLRRNYSLPIPPHCVLLAPRVCPAIFVSELFPQMYTVGTVTLSPALSAIHRIIQFREVKQ